MDMNPEIARYVELHKEYLALPDDDDRVDAMLDEMDRIWWTFEEDEKAEVCELCKEHPTG